MSLAHILSLSRVVAAPVIAALILAPPGNSFLLAAIVFCLASITDLLDGKLARYSQQASPLGVFLDTTADKVLVSLVLVALAIDMLSPAWIPIVIIGREFLISGLRSFAASNNRIISAHIWGKGKTALTMVGIELLLLAANGRSGRSSFPHWLDRRMAARGHWVRVDSGSCGGAHHCVGNPIRRRRMAPVSVECCLNTGC